MLRIRDLHVEYGGVPAIRGLDLDVGENEYVGIIGPNGAGKTTLLKAISGTVRSRRGELTFGDENVHGLPGHRRTELGLVHVPQGRRIFTQMTVRENLTMGGYRKAARKAVDARLELVFELFPVLGDRIAAFGGSLSGGQQQMLAIARGLMADPRLLLLDEPSMGLAPVVNEAIFEALVRLRELGGMAVLLVEQNAHEALDLCERAYLLESGVIAMEGPTEALMQEDSVVATYLGGG